VVEAAADSIRKGPAFGKGGGMIERPIAAKEFLPVAGPGLLVPAEIGERHTGAEIGAPVFPCEHRVSLGIDVRHDEWRRSRAGHA
jgi:hypothetical protein